jgi:hypothetical protein
MASSRRRRRTRNPVLAAKRAVHRVLTSRGVLEDPDADAPWKVKDRPWEVPDPREDGRHHYLAVCAIFKNEAPYLKEWLEFHRLVGVEKFYLYNNYSSDGYLDVLAPYVEAGIVTVHDIPVRPGQLMAYNSCLKTYGPNARWMAFLDIDEYLYALDEDSVADVLREYEDHAGVSIHWVMFNTSRHVLRPAGLTTENFTTCQVEGNKHVRIVVDPSRTEEIVNVHFGRYAEGERAVNENHEPIEDPEGWTAEGPVKPGWSWPVPTIGRLRVNHYWTRSVEEFFLNKLARGGFVDELRDVEGLLFAERAYSTGEDRQIQRFLPRLKAAVGSHDIGRARQEL